VLAAVDTNILAYAADLRRHPDDDLKISTASDLVADLIASDNLVVPVQALAELRHLLRRKAKVSDLTATEMVIEYADGALVAPTTEDVLRRAFLLSSLHQFQTYDAIILAAAAQAGCDVLYSEDMQTGFIWDGVEIVNPFAPALQ
jgi:predicted nucleic acid-binding protein